MHYFVNFPKHRGSYGLLSESDATHTAVFFVHGFWGDAQSTWTAFQTAIDVNRNASAFDQCDLLFYDYPSTRLTVPDASDELNKFLKQVLADGPFSVALEGRGIPGFVLPPAPDETGRHYTDVLLVGHSLGGVLVRRAIVSIAKDKRTNLSKKSEWPIYLQRSPVLFAPAHLGFRQGGTVASLAGANFLLAAAFALWQITGAKSYVDLGTDSNVLDVLRDATETFATNHPDCPGFQASLVWGRRDNFVVDEGYKTDPDGERIPDKGHRKICKPSDSYPYPVNKVMLAL